MLSTKCVYLDCAIYKINLDVIVLRTYRQTMTYDVLSYYYMYSGERKISGTIHMSLKKSNAV